MSAARMLAVLLCLGAAGAGFAAAPSPAEDSKAVARCVDAAQKADGFAGNCVGVVADPCIKAVRERDSAAEDAKACARRELAVWAARLKTALAAAAKNGGKDMASSVTAAQKAWTASQEKLCPLFDNLDPGASLGGADYCRLQETARRALVLERLAGAVSEH
ncbi:MAG TPA: lysozyme inhibitor LprI family protein [Xanthobacteraceae bacterium]|nr:lysozyme inhibitor LprI family protein [Xanthobacteraceae bacterium]